jgi:hypothetical protein
VITAAQHEVIGLEIARRLACLARELQRCKSNRQSAGDLARDLVLDCEQILHVAIILFRPEQGRARSLKKLHGNPGTFAGLSQTPVHQIGDTQLAADLFGTRRLALVGESGAARDHRHVGKSAKRRDDIFGEPIGEIVLRRIAREIGERHDHNRGMACGDPWA